MDTKYATRSTDRPHATEVFVCVVAAIALTLSILSVVFTDSKTFAVSLAVIVVAICVATVIFVVFNPDSVRARQTDKLLRLSGQMVDLMSNGMTPDVAQSICALLLPNTAAIAVAITNTTTILGYVGYAKSQNPQGANIRTQATHDAIADGEMRVLRSANEIGIPETYSDSIITGAIIVPLYVGREIRGTLKFYYKSPRKITETQKSIAQGFGNLLSIQLAAVRLEEQRELATKMELKMLQNQINPHFLFNTINTIASFIRTDPSKAYVLLRDFAVFYRATLENAQELIPLSRELQQTMRYFSFEIARFGEDRLGMEVRVHGFGSESGDMPAAAAMSVSVTDVAQQVDDKSQVSDNADNIDDESPKNADGESVSESDEPLKVSDMKVPPFLLQPLVENAVKHAMPSTGKLTIGIWSDISGQDVLVHVEDNGLGMTEEAKQSIMHPESSTGLGIAVKNVHDRMHGYFGEDAEMLVESELGKGTVVTLKFPGVADALRSK